jgi:sugar O-acyltransferase (sialic acid O-acetyltransferase NeuD family)
MFGWINRSPGFIADGEEVGFLDDDPDALKPFPAVASRWRGSVVSYEPAEADRLVMAVGAPAAKAHIAEMLEARGAQFTTFVHTSVLMNDGVSIGRGAVLCPNVVVSCNATVGDFVSANLAATIGHDATVGRFSSLMSHVDITGNAVLGERVFVGSHATILPGVHVGDAAVVGAGSSVIRRVATNATVIGVPAQRLM